MRAILKHVVWSALAVFAAACSGVPNTQTAMLAVKAGPTPNGFRDYCNRYPAECRVVDGPARPVNLTSDRWSQLEDVQRSVNYNVPLNTDSRLYGKEDWWDYPGKEGGDCEDYVLEKRRQLIAKGWPRSSLIIATGVNEIQEYHAVLVAVTDQGDFVLDNRWKGVKHWEELPYQWVLRQSRLVPTQWLQIANHGVSPGSVVSGNHIKAAAMFRRSSEADKARSRVQFAAANGQGAGVARNGSKSVSWYQKSLQAQTRQNLAAVNTTQAAGLGAHTPLPPNLPSIPLGSVIATALPPPVVTAAPAATVTASPLAPRRINSAYFTAATAAAPAVAPVPINKSGTNIVLVKTKTPYEAALAVDRYSAATRRANVRPTLGQILAASAAAAPAPTPAPAPVLVRTAVAPSRRVVTPIATGASNYRVQLASLVTYEAAENERYRLLRAYAALLSHLQAEIVRADLGSRGVYYRVRVGGLADGYAARSLCAQLTEQNVACLVVRAT